MVIMRFFYAKYWGKSTPQPLYNMVVGSKAESVLMKQLYHNQIDNKKKLYPCMIIFLFWFVFCIIYTFLGSVGKPWPEVIKLFSYSTQLSMKFFLLINIKMPTIVGILIFISRKNFMLNSALQKKKV